ncbi:hypothetical protein M1L60_10560 [Actinoplanes sp. TRM 88003]|uniref:KTSC domain-containing protein n=1 Tax=Paractinoplanes aksuensis TaxID=2939490 RepID=A0ABT1DJQ7_9ACTN|nr:hypothetical protein [Actinoplanes aksuensis]MCO8271034.1 hypothetical protein [Actinoplanes aksuensis]
MVQAVENRFAIGVEVRVSPAVAALLPGSYGTISNVRYDAASGELAYEVRFAPEDLERFYIPVGEDRFWYRPNQLEYHAGAVAA